MSRALDALAAERVMGWMRDGDGLYAESYTEFDGRIRWCYEDYP